MFSWPFLTILSITGVETLIFSTEFNFLLKFHKTVRFVKKTSIGEGGGNPPVVNGLKSNLCFQIHQSSFKQIPLVLETAYFLNKSTNKKNGATFPQRQFGQLTYKNWTHLTLPQMSYGCTKANKSVILQKKLYNK